MDADDARNFSLPRGWRWESSKEGPVLFTKEGLKFSLPFSPKKPLSHKQPMARAIGFKEVSLQVLDVTGGWGQDAFLISQMGCIVKAVESNPFVFYFVRESLRKAQIPPSRLNFILDNSFNYLNNLKSDEYPDVIFMDPMFGERKKSLSGKSLRILKELVGETKDQGTLLDLALKKARQRVVVKRHKWEAPLKDKPLCTFEGRSVCYDVFRPEGFEV